MDKNKKIQSIMDNMEITRAVNTVKLENARFNVSEKEVLKEINTLNAESKKERKIQFSGTSIYLLSVLGLIASTSLSIAGGLDMYPKHKFAFVIAIVFVQLVIFKVSTSTTIIKQNFNSHYDKVKLMQYGLLSVVIFYNYSFFYSYLEDKGILLKVMTFVLCFLMDYSTMQFVSLAFDQKHLNYTHNNEFKDDTNILSMILFNFTFRTRITALKQYQNNINEYKSIKNTEPVISNLIKIEEIGAEIKQIEESKVEDIDLDPLVNDDEKIKSEGKFQMKPLEIGNIKKFLDYLKENSKDDIAMGYRQAGKDLELTSGETQRIYNRLKENKYLEIDGKKTKIKNKIFNESDFLEV